VGAWDSWWKRNSDSIDLVVLKRQHARWLRHAARAAERAEWLSIRDELEALKLSAVSAREFKLVTSLQHQLHAHLLTSNCQQLSERHYNSLPPRRRELLALFENKAKELSVSRHALELQEIARLSRALTEVEIFEQPTSGTVHALFFIIHNFDNSLGLIFPFQLLPRHFV